MKVYNVPDGLGGANSNIKCINNGLAKVLLHSGGSQATQVDSVEALLVPGNENYPNVNIPFHNVRKMLIYQKLALLNCSMYRVSSLKGAMCRSPLEGNILPRCINVN